MSQFSMTCSCGDPMSVDAASRPEAVAKLQGIMSAEAIKGHMLQKHPGEPIPTVAQIHGQIAQNLQLA